MNEVRSFRGLLVGESPAVRRLAMRLRILVRSSLGSASEHRWTIDLLTGGIAKVAIYSVDAGTRVVCGLRLYPLGCRLRINHVRRIDAPRLALRGRGGSRFVDIGPTTNYRDEDMRRLLKKSLARARRRPVLKVRRQWVEERDGTWVVVKSKSKPSVRDNATTSSADEDAV